MQRIGQAMGPWPQFLALMPPSLATLGKLCSLSGPPILPPGNSTNIVELLLKLKILLHVKHLVYCVAHKYSIIIMSIHHTVSLSIKENISMNYQLY